MTGMRLEERKALLEARLALYGPERPGEPIDRTRARTRAIVELEEVYAGLGDLGLAGPGARLPYRDDD